MLKHVHERDWLYLGHRSTEWCPRCGTSISQHELTMAGVYQDRADPSLFVRFPLLDHRGESLVIWTTTPWTLAANVAAAVNSEADYGRRANGEWVAVARYPDDTFEETLRGSELVGWRYDGPFDARPAASAVEHRVIEWDEVSLEEGTGIVHIAPGCGGEDFELGRREGLRILTPVDEAGHFYDDYGWLHGLSTIESADQIVGDLGERGLLVEAGLYEHRYPHCWRCDTPLIFRIADDWFISVRDLRQPMLDANETVDWTPEYMGKRMDDWLRNMGDWNISRRRYYGLPLPFYPCTCGHLNVIGSKAELEERALGGLEQLQELRRPWIDRGPVRCERCGEAVERVKEVGDVWLDAGIVPFSTLGWQNPKWIPEGYATGAARGLTHADLPDHQYWEKWFPADWVSEMREQIRLWFYSQLFMSVVLTGRAPFKRVLGYEKMLDENGREMHGSWGNMIPAEEAFSRMGADVMRWQFAAQPFDRNLLFGFGPADEIKRELLTLWNSVSFFVSYANIDGFRPSWPEVPEPDRALLDEIADLRRVVTLAHQARATSGLKLRQPLRKLVVEGAPSVEAHADELASEVRVKVVEFGPVEAELRVKPNLPALGPRLGKELRAVQQALQGGEFEELDGGRFRAAGQELEPHEVLVERAGSDGAAVASMDGVTVALDTTLDDELVREGRVYDLIRAVQNLRKTEGLELTDRIVLTVPQADAELVEPHGDWIKEEVLAVEIRPGSALGIEKAASGD